MMNPSAFAPGSPSSASGASAQGAGAASASAAAGAAIDGATLARLHELDPGGHAGIVQRVLRTYDGALAAAISSIAAAADAERATELRHLTHTLKSSSASVGALQLAALCGEAERIAREGWSDALKPLTARLVEEAWRVQAALGQLLPGAR